MKKEIDGFPLCGESARCLGVRVEKETGNKPLDKNQYDIPIDKNERVKPLTGGMSVYENPEKLPKHRKPSWMDGGEGRDPLFQINQKDLSSNLKLRYDGKESHALIEPANICKYFEYSSALCSTRKYWRIICQTL